MVDTQNVVQQKVVTQELLQSVLAAAATTRR